MCQTCAAKEQKPIPKRSTKKTIDIAASDIYYNESIQKNVSKYGYCKCEECGDAITNPKGRNVCHVLGGGAYKVLYFNPINHFILCLRCGDIEQSGDRTKMKIWPKFKEIRLQLLQTLIPESRK